MAVGTLEIVVASPNNVQGVILYVRPPGRQVHIPSQLIPDIVSSIGKFDGLLFSAHAQEDCTAAEQQPKSRDSRAGTGQHNRS
jgi:hypothetical protein